MDRFYIRLIILFCAINGVGIAYSHLLEKWGVVNLAGMTGNILLASVTAVSFYVNRKAILAQNNHAFVRLVYLSTFIKLLICAAAVVVYVYAFRSQVTAGTIILFFLLYILYTILETLSLMKVSKPRSN